MAKQIRCALQERRAPSTSCEKAVSQEDRQLVQPFIALRAASQFAGPAQAALEQTMSKEPILICCKVLEMKEFHSKDGNSISRRYKLRPLGQVKIYPEKKVK